MVEIFSIHPSIHPLEESNWDTSLFFLFFFWFFVFKEKKNGMPNITYFSSPSPRCVYAPRHRFEEQMGFES
jgi:hypothetical protein